MKKYQIYSGPKPSAANKTMAVYSGGKYFTVSQTTGSEGLSPNPLNSLTVDGTKVTANIINKNNADSVKQVLLNWSCTNANVSSSAVSASFPSGTGAVLGPTCGWTYTWDVASLIKPGTNAIQLTTRVDPIYGYQTQSGSSTLGDLKIYKRFKAPEISMANVRFTNTTYSYTSQWVYGGYYSLIEGFGLDVVAKNPNEISAKCYKGSVDLGVTVPSVGTSTVTSNYAFGKSLVDFNSASSSKSVTPSTSYYYLNGVSDNGNSETKSVAGTVTPYVLTAPPQFISCVPTSTTSTSFQVTVKNNNSSQKYCYVKYFRYDSSTASTDYWLANCPANGSGTLIDTAGNTRTFTMTRGGKYVIMLYFVDSRNYSGKQVSQSSYYPFVAPDSGYLYVSPIVVSETYDDDSNPTEVTFTIANNNNEVFDTRLDLYSGSGTSGTRVDYWKVNVPARSQAKCKNTWSVSAGSTYTLKAYFMAVTSGNSGTQKSGAITYTFTVGAST